ncbi:MAG: hypothetical protein ACPKPY_00960 [Nitrososphaeraceae archaeon]
MCIKLECYHASKPKPKPKTSATIMDFFNLLTDSIEVLLIK